MVNFSETTGQKFYFVLWLFSEDVVLKNRTKYSDCRLEIYLPKLKVVAIDIHEKHYASLIERDNLITLIGDVKAPWITVFSGTFKEIQKVMKRNGKNPLFWTTLTITSTYPVLNEEVNKKKLVNSLSSLISDFTHKTKDNVELDIKEKLIGIEDIHWTKAFEKTCEILKSYDFSDVNSKASEIIESSRDWDDSYLYALDTLEFVFENIDFENIEEN